MADLAGRRVLVTGGSSGIGLSIVEAALAAGADVACCGLDTDAPASAGQLANRFQRTFYYQRVDLSDLQGGRSFVATALKVLGGLDGIVNNAGTDFNDGVLDASFASIQRCLLTNFYSAWAITQAAYPALKQSGEGVILNISSVHSGQTAPGAFPYNVSKRALDALTMSIAQEWARDNIVAVGIAPGWIDTPLTQQELARKGSKTYAELAAAHLLGRIGRTQDIASLAVFVLARECQFLNGGNIVVDGGQCTLFQPH